MRESSCVTTDCQTLHQNSLLTQQPWLMASYKNERVGAWPIFYVISRENWSRLIPVTVKIPILLRPVCSVPEGGRSDVFDRRRCIGLLGCDVMKWLVSSSAVFAPVTWSTAAVNLENSNCDALYGLCVASSLTCSKLISFHTIAYRGKTHVAYLHLSPFLPYTIWYFHFTD